ncbi:MAG: light-harvesting protein [Pseudomonadota bacterium]
MNNARIWLVVSPSVGIPIFLGAVAVGSFAVHMAVVSNSDWVSDFLNGDRMGGERAAMIEQDAVKPASLTATAAGASVFAGETIEVTLPDGTKATAVIQAPSLTEAAYDPPDRTLR